MPSELTAEQSTLVQVMAWYHQAKNITSANIDRSMASETFASLKLPLSNGSLCLQTCTDVLCTWNESTMKGVEPALIKDIQFYTAEAKANIDPDSQRRAKPPPMTSDEQQALILRLLAKAKTLPSALSLFK